MGTSHLVLRAGPRAQQKLQTEGFDPDLFGTLVGASGGPKWLVLRHLDAVLVDRLVHARSTPLDTLGSSIGSFRHACYAQSDPHAALERFEKAYIEQAYHEDGPPPMDAIATESERILGVILGEKGAEEICRNPFLRSHFVAARLTHDRGLDRGLRFKSQLATAAAHNLVSRRRLGRSFTRIVFHSGARGPSIQFDDMPTVDIAMHPAQVRRVLLASGTIPLLMRGVRSIPDRPGTYFDGGIIDYHFDFAFRRNDRLVLFNHFFDRITPGWLDKPLRWRKPSIDDLADVLMIAPSDKFIADLPGGKVPDRKDFFDLETEARIDRWREIVSRCRVLGQELEDLIDSGQIADRVQPFG